MTAQEKKAAINIISIFKEALMGMNVRTLDNNMEQIYNTFAESINVALGKVGDFNNDFNNDFS